MKISATTRKYVVFVLLVAISGWLFCIINSPFEPRYQGKTLSAWTINLCDDTGFDPDFTPPQIEENGIDEEVIAADAIRHIGIKALPYAISLCQAKDSRIKDKLLDWADADRKLWGIQLVSALEDHKKSWRIFQSLGAAAKPAIPKLIKLLGNADRNVVSTAGNDLIYIGSDAIAPVVVELTNQNARVRESASFVLAGLGRSFCLVTNIAETNGEVRTILGPVQEKFRPQLAPVFPLLLQMVNDEDMWVRHAAAYALAQCDAEPSSAVPAIIAALEKETDYSQPYLFLALRRYKTNASAAVPLLLKIVKQESPTQTGHALRALREIDPEAAKPFVEMRRTSLPNPRVLNAISNQPLKQLENSAPNAQINSVSP